MKEIDKNYEFFKNNKKNINKKFANKYLIISNEEVIFADNSKDKVIEFAKELQAGSYIIQKSELSEEKQTQTFHTRVRFNGQ